MKLLIYRNQRRLIHLLTKREKLKHPLLVFFWMILDNVAVVTV